MYLGTLLLMLMGGVFIIAFLAWCLILARRIRADWSSIRRLCDPNTLVNHRTLTETELLFRLSALTDRLLVDDPRDRTAVAYRVEHQAITDELDLRRLSTEAHELWRDWVANGSVSNEHA